MLSHELKFSLNRFERRIRSKDRKRNDESYELWKSFERETKAKQFQQLALENGIALPPELPIPPPTPFSCIPPRQPLNVAEVAYHLEAEPCEDPYLEPTEGMAIRKAYRLLDRLRPISNNRTARCRRFRLHKTIQVFSDGETAWVSGVQTCNNVWGCPVCSTVIQSRRAAEIDSAIDQWIRYGTERRGPATARAYMLTLTIRHAISHRLELTSHLIAEAWSEMFSGRRGQQMRKLLGMSHFVRALEPTYGENGWHPHLHCILLTDDELTADTEKAIHDRWAECLSIHAPQQARFQPNEKHGVKLRELYQSRDGRYVAKMFLELQSYATKEARNGNLTYWAVARRAADGDRRYVHVWEDAQHALFGRKQLTWSHGCRSFFSLPDLADEDILDEDGIKAQNVAEVFQLEIPGRVWDQAWRSDRFFLSTLLGLITQAVQTGDYVAVLSLLSEKLSRQGGGTACNFGVELTRVVPAAC